VPRRQNGEGAWEKISQEESERSILGPRWKFACEMGPFLSASFQPRRRYYHASCPLYNIINNENKRVTLANYICDGSTVHRKINLTVVNPKRFQFLSPTSVKSKRLERQHGDYFELPCEINVS